MKMRRRTFAAAAAILAVLAAGCGKAKDEAADTPEAATPVQTESAVVGAIDRVITASAVLYPINQANVMPKLSAPVKRVMVNRGDHVKAGQLLAELEGADLTAAANESRSQYEQAQSALQTVTGGTLPDDLTKAQADAQSAQQVYDGAQALYNNRVALQKEGALARKLVDEARVSLAQAQAQLETSKRHLESLNKVTQRESERSARSAMDAAKAHYEGASAQASYTQIRAPISGVVADRAVYPGEIPAASMPLVSIVDISEVVARANVPVKEASGIRLGRPVRVTGPEGDIPGKVTVVSPAVDSGTTTVQVWVQLKNPGEKLKPGATVQIAILADTLKDTVIVPAAAILNGDDGGQKVMVIDGKSVAHERKVNVGVRQGDRVQIVSGLQAGEQVVTSGGLGLDDKAKVTIEQPKSDEDEDEDKDDAK